MTHLILPDDTRVPVNTHAIVGRDPSCDVIIDEPSVSRRHALVTRLLDDRVMLVDLGSSAGTVLDDRRVQSAVLANGSTIRLGSVRVRFERGTAATTSEPSVDLQFPSASGIANDGEVRWLYRQLHTAYTVTRAVGTEVQLPKIVDRILDAAFDLLSSDRGAVVLIDPITREPRQEFLRSIDPDHPAKALSRTVLQRVLDSNEGLLLAVAQDAAEFKRSESMMADGVRSAMCVPLKFEGVSLGVIQVDSLHATHAFTRSDLALFTAIAHQAGLTIRAAQLRDSLAREAQRADRSARLAMVGQLAAGVAHDFANMLTVIMDGAESIREATTNEEVVREADLILEVSARGDDTIRELMTIGDEDEVVLKEVDLSVVLPKLWPALKHAGGREVEVRLRAPEAPLTIEFDIGHLERILVNMVVNVRDAIATTGTIEIRVRASSSIGNTIDILSPNEHDWILIEVEDDGPGMDAAVLEHVFEPYFTTKNRSRVRGLGLATVDQLVRRARGETRVRSTPGVGTIFTLAFPAVAPSGSRDL